MRENFPFTICFLSTLNPLWRDSACDSARSVVAVLTHNAPRGFPCTSITHPFLFPPPLPNLHLESPPLPFQLLQMPVACCYWLASVHLRFTIQLGGGFSFSQLAFAAHLPAVITRMWLQTTQAFSLADPDRGGGVIGRFSPESPPRGRIGRKPAKRPVTKHRRKFLPRFFFAEANCLTLLPFAH